MKKNSKPCMNWFFQKHISNKSNSIVNISKITENYKANDFISETQLHVHKMR